MPVWMNILIAVLLTHLPTARCDTNSAPRNIAVILPESGEWAVDGLSMHNAAVMAAEDLSSPNDSPFRLWFYDDCGDPDSAQSLAEHLVSTGEVSALMGGYPSATAEAIIQVLANPEIPFLIMSSSADSLTMGSGSPVFRIAPPTSLYNDGLFAFAAGVVGVDQRLAVVYDGSKDWANRLTELQTDIKDKWSGEVRYLSLPISTYDLKGLVQDLSRFDPRAVWMLIGTGDAARLLIDCRQSDWAPAAFLLGSVNLANLRLVSASDGAAEYVYAPAVWFPTPVNPQASGFKRRFMERFGEEPDYHAAETYAAVQVMDDAQRRSMEQGITLRRALSETDLATVLGRMQFQDFGEFQRQSRVQTLALQLIQNQWRVIWPLEEAQDRYVYPTPEWRERLKPPRINQNQSLYNLLFIFVTGALLIAALIRRRQLLKRM